MVAHSLVATRMLDKFIVFDSFQMRFVHSTGHRPVFQRLPSAFRRRNLRMNCRLQMLSPKHFQATRLPWLVRTNGRPVVLRRWLSHRCALDNALSCNCCLQIMVYPNLLQAMHEKRRPKAPWIARSKSRGRVTLPRTLLLACSSPRAGTRSPATPRPGTASRQR